MQNKEEKDPQKKIKEEAELLGNYFGINFYKRYKLN